MTKSTRKCVVCRLWPAEVPDRENPRPSMPLRVCRVCHSQRLAEDFARMRAIDGSEVKQ